MDGRKGKGKGERGKRGGRIWRRVSVPVVRRGVRVVIVVLLCEDVRNGGWGVGTWVGVMVRR